MRVARAALLALLILTSPLAHAIAPNPWNILWVVDNSASMQEQRAILSKKAPDFVKLLKDRGVTEFRMAVTTTDALSDGGKLVSGLTGFKIVDSKMPDPGGALTTLFGGVADTITSFWEQGLEASRRAIDAEGDLFLRDGEPLAVIYITDEDDYSCEADCFGVEPEHNPNWKPFPIQRYVQFFADLKSKRHIDTYLFPIVGILEGNCSVSSFGVKYLKVRSQVGGMSGSICPSEFETSLMAVAGKITSIDLAPTSPVVLVNPVRLPEAREDQLYTADLAPFVKGSGTLTFSKLSGPRWLVVGSDGTVGGTPVKADVGMTQAKARVCNEKQACADFTIELTVLHMNHPPIWKSNPIVMPSAKVNQPWRFSLCPFVYDPDGDPISLRVPFLPIWVTLNGCELSGTPKPEDLLSAWESVLHATDQNGLSARAVARGRVIAR